MFDRFPAALLCLALGAGTGVGPVAAKPTADMVEPVTRFVGQMSIPMPSESVGIRDIDNTLRFEPLQNFEEMFQRDDVVFLMRHGPTDWNKLDIKNVAPTDCENQRILSDQGATDMRDFGALLAFNDILPAKIIVSEWCRNQQTYDRIAEGYEAAKPGLIGDVPVETRSDLNLLLSLQGARNVTNLRRIVSEWDGAERPGPLFIISHFTNIQELTEFAVYEGEALVIDPDRDNRVLGYMRLRTAGPDVGHFDTNDQDALYDDDGSLNEAAVERFRNITPVTD